MKQNPENKNALRIKRENPYVQVDREFIRNKSISIEARGLFAMMLSHDENWTFYKSQLQDDADVGRDKLGRMLKELQDHGYLNIIPSRKEGGKFGEAIWELDEFPEVASPHTENPSTVKPSTVKPDTANPHLRRNNNKKKKLKEEKQQDPLNPPMGEGDLFEGDNLEQHDRTSETEKKEGLSDDDIFNFVYERIRTVTPTARRGRHSKKDAKRLFLKIASRKTDPISADKIAHALLWFYDTEDQTKDNRAFMTGIQVVLRQERFIEHLDQGKFKKYNPGDAVAPIQDRADDTTAEQWDFVVRRWLNQGDWSGIGPAPDEPGCLVPKDILKSNGIALGAN